MATVKLRSSDGVVFEVDVEVAKCSRTIKNVIKNSNVELENEPPIDISVAKGDILRRIIEWAKRHVNDNNEDEESGKKEVDISGWDSEFFAAMDQATLFDLILAANFLDVRRLTAMGCQVVANMIKEKEPEEIRALFGIECDLTPEEQERIRQENEWTEERC